MADKDYLFKPGNTITRTGVKNKATQSLKNFMQAFTEEQSEEIAAAFSRLSDKDKISAWLAMVQYCVPKKATVEHTKQLEIPEELNALSFEQLCQIEDIIKGKQQISYQVLPGTDGQPF